MPNDITVTKNTTVGSERWDVEYTADQAGTVTKTMDTAGTMMDRDIKVSITTPAGSVVTPTTSITANPSISVDSSGLITSSVSASQSVTPAVSVGFVSVGTANPGTVSVSGSNTSQLSTQAGTTISPTESEQTAVTAGKYTTGAVKVGAISSTYVGSGITQRTSSDLSASGATVTAPAGYYPNAAAKTVTSGSATTPATTITPNAISISVNSSTGVITASNTQKTQSVTPTVSAGYVSSGTAGTITVSAASNTSNLTTQAAQTIHPSTSDQTISSGKYLTGTQTIKGVLLTNLTAENIADGVTVKVGDSTDDDCVTSITGTHSGGGGGNPVAEEKDVNFIDYDGTIRYSYTAQEFAALSALPANPSHDGLTAQGWNWTLANAKTYVASYGRLWIGQMYATTDNKTHVYIRLEEGRLSPMLGCCPNGTVVVDWGDGSATTTLTGTSLSTVKWTSTHNYAAPGDYEITLNVTSGTMALSGTSSSNQYSYLLRYSSSGDSRNYAYRDAIKRVEIGASTSINAYAFYLCYSLQSVTIPDTVTSMGSNAFYSCYSLQSITMPSSVTSVVSNAFYACNSLQSVTIPSSVTNISSGAFYYCYSLQSITIPSSVTNIYSTAFYYCYSLGAIHFKPTTPPTVASSNVWTSVPADCQVYVPAASFGSYYTLTNKPTGTYIGYATYAFGATLPATVDGYTGSWYPTKRDAINMTNAISVGNGSEVYFRYIAGNVS